MQNAVKKRLFDLRSPRNFRAKGNYCSSIRLLIACSLFCNCAFPLQAQDQTGEFRIKAAFLFHFAQLVDWPPEALGPDNRPFSICMTGEDMAPGAVESIVEGKQIGERPIKVRHLQENEDAQSCQVLFIVTRDKKRVAAILTALKSAAVLTVGDSDNFAGQGGMIGFSIEDNKIRFDINLQAAQRARLKISSRLLLLAKRVVGDAGQG